jgi:hypothetical protein
VTAQGWAGLFLLGAALNILAGWTAWPDVLAGSLNDPDSYMRLERILQGIAQGHLVNVVARDDSGAGVMVEWSRLLDALLWAMALPFAGLLGWRQALFGAGVALGPLGAGALGVALAFAAKPFSRAKFLWLAPVAAALLPGLHCFAIPGVVHYHILLLALIALTAGLVARGWNGGTGWGFLAGLAGGFAIWLTPETMPFVLMAYTALVFRWVEKPIGSALAAAAAGCFDVLGFGLAIDPPEGGYGVAEIDRLSLVYVVMALLLLAGALALWRLEQWPNPSWRRLSGLALMAALFAAWVAAFPAVVMGPYGIMDAADRQRFFGAIMELRPVLGLDNLVAFLLPGALAVLYLGWHAIQGRAPQWVWWYLTLCAAVALVLGQRFVLFVEFSAGLAAGLIPVILTYVSLRLKGKPLAAMASRLGLVFLLLVAPELATLAATKPSPAGQKYPSCSLRNIGGMLAPYAGEVMLSDVSDAPELLYRSKILTVGSLYQHGVPGFLRARDAWRSAAGASLPPALTASGARYVLFCPVAQRYDLVADLPKNTLWDALAAGQPPGWLRLQASDATSGWRLYAVSK